MQLFFLQHSQIDKQRWLQTIQQCSNGLIYAWPQFLDAMSPGWQALVNSDYSLLMPLTYKKKFGIKYLSQPPFCQQLGIFGTTEITPEIVCNFLSEAKKEFWFAEINLNEKNSFFLKNSKFRKNYILRLSENYATLQNFYRHDVLKKDLLRSRKIKLVYEPLDNLNLAVANYQKFYSGRTSHITKKNYDSLCKLCLKLKETGNAFGRAVRSPHGELLACDIFLKDEKRIYYLLSATLANGRSLKANHFLIDNLIQEFACKELLLDFEGSDIIGIERFCQKWGANNQPYLFYKWNHLPWPLRLLKK